MSERRPALVTGASGFLGRHLARALLRQGRSVTAIIRNPHHMADLKHPDLQVIEIPDFSQIESTSLLQENLTLFHLACARARPGIKAAQFQAVNVDATLLLAEAACKARVCKFIYVSTALIFDGDGERSVSEIDLDPQRRFDNPYLQSRLDAMVAVGELVKQGLDLVCVCPSIIYGPDHRSHPNRLTQQMRRLLRTGIDVVVGDGNQKRDLVYVDDVVAGILGAERVSASGEMFILGGEAVSHRRFNDLVLELGDRRRRLRMSVPVQLARCMTSLVDRIRRNKDGYGYTIALQSLMRSWVFSSRKATEVLGYSPRPLVMGIQDTINWLEKGKESRV